MVPQSFAALYSFLALVAPGLVFQMLRERRRPALEETSFREAGRIALTSLGFTTASMVLISLFSPLFPSVVPDLPRWIAYGNDYLRFHFWMITSAILIEVVLACALAVAVSMCLGDHGLQRPSLRIFKGPGTIEKTGIWYRLFYEELPPNHAPWVTLSLTDGTRIWGYAHLYTVGQKLEEREILLSGPGLTFQEKGSDKRHTEYRYITVKAVDLVTMKIKYLPRLTKPSVPAQGAEGLGQSAMAGGAQEGADGWTPPSFAGQKVEGETADRSEQGPTQ